MNQSFINRRNVLTEHHISSNKSLYSFPVPLRVGGCVCLDDLVKCLID